MSSCGVKNVIYLIEENIPESCAFGADTIYSAMVQCQIADDFFLKETESAFQTVNYLTGITSMIETIYKETNLNVMESGVSDSETFKSEMKRLQSEDIKYAMTLDTFNDLNTKRGAYSVKDVWIRQLITIKGMSAQKAVCLAKHYPTLNTLMEDFQTFGVNLMVEKMGQIGTGRNALGAALIQKIANIFYNEKYEDYLICLASVFALILSFDSCRRYARLNLSSNVTPDGFSIQCEFLRVFVSAQSHSGY